MMRNEEKQMAKKICTLLAFIIVCTLILSACSVTPEVKNTLQEIMDPDNATDRNMTMNVSIEGESTPANGLYTGPLKDGKAHGEGVFSVDMGSGNKLIYKGSFISGHIDGEGVLTITINEGEIKYSGNFEDGALNGHGIAVATAEGDTLTRKGTYTRGAFTPTTGEKYDYLGQLNLFGTFSLSEEVIEYIDSHPKYFPKIDSSIVKVATPRDFQYKQFKKSRKQDEIGLITLTLNVAQVFEDPIEDIDETVTYLLAADADGNYYSLYYLDSAEVLEDDKITVYALPVAASSFDNVGGGVTNVIVLLGSSLKVQK